ncbi:hypothetical protein AX16_000434 [Volvariella volvacea WC 439]|nr:hypothetical protein AX16_000434 [Volvariella volvacea WC 439]
MVQSVNYKLITAFSTDPNGGNPAAVVFLDSPLPEQDYLNIAANLNQPITSFVFPPSRESDNPQTKRLAIRFFTSPGIEPSLCGHGTLAASKAVFGEPGYTTEETTAVEFETKMVGIVRAEMHKDGIIEIKLPTTDLEPVSQEEFARLAQIIFAAFGNDVNIQHIARGQGSFEKYLLVVFDEKDGLKGRKANANALLATGYDTHVFTTESSNGDELFVSRMFNPEALPGGEDHVCGSAHCLSGPYWYKRKGIDIGSVVKAKQVSARGGELQLILQEDGFLRLGGQLKEIGEGRLWL